MNRVLAVSLEKKFEKFEKGAERAVLEILKILNKIGVSAEIYLINSRKMRFLNKKFRGKDKTTTVLSFEEPRNFIYPELKLKRIGEIYLNLTADQRLTKDNSRQLSVAGYKLLIHGILHLLGYNHKKKGDRIRMEKKEQYVYNRFRLRNIAN